MGGEIDRREKGTGLGTALSFAEAKGSREVKGATLTWGEEIKMGTMFLEQTCCMNIADDVQPGRGQILVADSLYNVFSSCINCPKIEMSSERRLISMKRRVQGKDRERIEDGSISKAQNRKHPIICKPLNLFKSH